MHYPRFNIHPRMVLIMALAMIRIPLYAQPDCGKVYVNLNALSLTTIQWNKLTVKISRSKSGSEHYVKLGKQRPQRRDSVIAVPHSGGSYRYELCVEKVKQVLEVKFLNCYTNYYIDWREKKESVFINDTLINYSYQSFPVCPGPCVQLISKTKNQH